MHNLFRRIRQGLTNPLSQKERGLEAEGSTDKSASPIGRYLLYAFGEILLVMIGILLALQVNNWNENRKDRIQEKILLKELNEEFKTNLQEFEGTLKWYDEVRMNLEKIINSFPINLRSINFDSLAYALENIQFQGNYDRTVIAISKLKSSGSFDIVSNEELRSLLMKWEVMDADYLYDEQRSLLFHEEQFAPWMYKKFPRPFAIGLRDDRVNLHYLESLEFEGMIRLKYRLVNNLFRSMRSEPNLVTVMERIIELTDSE